MTETVQLLLVNKVVYSPFTCQALLNIYTRIHTIEKPCTCTKCKKLFCWKVPCRDI
jgi:hypothetical protein